MDSKLPPDLSPELSPKVVEAIRQNRKIEAIKHFREETGLGLKEAKTAVDAYARNNPSPLFNRQTRSDTGLGRLALISAGVTVALVVYWFLL